jgi:hypothetical protein
MNFNNLFISLALPLFLLAGCSATTSGSTHKTSVEKAMDDCVVSVTSGAILGAILGAAVGGDVGDGALLGGAAGVGVCGFLINRASEEDKARMAEIELAALNSPVFGETRQSFVSTNGKDVFSVKTATKKVEQKDVPKTILNNPDTSTTIYDTSVGCKNYKTDIIVGSKIVTKSGISCRTITGDWVNF